MTLQFRTDNGSLASGYVEKLSQKNQEKFEAYLVSEESVVVRKMILEIIRQRTNSKPANLKGVLIISLVLGDGPGFPNQTGKKKSGVTKCADPKGFQIYASYVSPTVQYFKSQPAVASLLECNTSNCCGCCGVGCLGCTGCYTSACYVHDLCVDLYGHAVCLAFVYDAAVSILNECPVV